MKVRIYSPKFKKLRGEFTIAEKTRGRGLIFIEALPKTVKTGDKIVFLPVNK
jgi:hypothetical protein